MIHQSDEAPYQQQGGKDFFTPFRACTKTRLASRPFSIVDGHNGNIVIPPKPADNKEIKLSTLPASYITVKVPLVSSKLCATDTQSCSLAAPSTWLLHREGCILDWHA